MKKLFLITGAVLCITIAPSLAQTEPLFLSQDTKYNDIKVTEVLSCDRIRLETNERVQLIGLKALDKPPRKKIERDQFGFVIDDEDPTQSLEEKAFDFVKYLLTDARVRLEFDTQKREADQTLLAYVYLVDSGVLVNAEILRQGFASLRLEPPNLKHADVLRAAYQEARTEKRGLEGL